MKKVFGVCALLLALLLLTTPGVSAAGSGNPGSPPCEENPATPPPDTSGPTGGDGEDGEEGDPDDIIEGNKLSDGPGGIGDANGVGGFDDRHLWELIRQLMLHIVGLPR